MQLRRIIAYFGSTMVQVPFSHLLGSLKLWTQPICVTILAVAIGGLPSANPVEGGEPISGFSSDVETLSLGGRLYDNLWNVVGRRPPATAHPSFPEVVKTYNEKTWRCVSCHGWDYKGRDGDLGQVSKDEAFASLAPAIGRNPAELLRIIRTGTHKNITKVLSSDQMKALSVFLSRGQHSIAYLVDKSGAARGVSERGKIIYDGACVRCHQADGKAVIYGEEGDVASLGWIARNRPAQALHKIRNGVAKADMLTLRFMPLDQIADLLAYLQQLDPQAPDL